VWELNIYGCWTLVVFWCWLAALTYLVRFWKGKWRQMRVIEMDRPETASPLVAAESSAL
jgi:hypothetical protein